MSDYRAASNHASMESLEPRLLLSVSLPEPANILAPSDDPTLPGAMDVFAPSVASVTPDSGAPAFSEWTRMADPDESVVAAGWQLSDYTGADHGKDTRFVAYGQTDSGDAVQTDVDILHLDGDKATILMDAGLPDDSAYMVWAENADGLGYPFMVNTAQTWWLGPDLAAVGDTVSVYGRNLSHDHGESDAWIYIQPSGGSGQWVTPTAVNPYKVDFTVPSGLSGGDYEIWIHNGHGGEYGWADPLTLSVESDFTYSGSTIDVTSYGATGGDTTDDATAIQNAIDACSSGDTLYFPAGAYYSSAQLTPKNGVRWLGDGMDSSYLKLHSNYAGPYCLLFRNSGLQDARFENMTFDTNGYASAGTQGLMWMRFGDSISFEDCRLTTAFENAKVVDIHGSEHVSFDDCEFVGGVTSIMSAQQVFFDGCDWYGTNDANSLVVGRSGQYSFSDCTGQDYDNTRDDGWCDGRFFTGAGVWGSTDRQYFGNCSFFDMTPRPDVDWQNQGEVLMWEQGDIFYNGSPTSVTDTTLTFDDLPDVDFNTSYRVTVVDGKGIAQIRAIDAYDDVNGVITLDSAWTLNPDTASTILITRAVDKVAVYKNFIDAKDRAHESETHIAASGVEPFDGSMNLVVEQTVFNDLRFGLDLFARWDDPEVGIHPIMFNHFEDNRFIDTRWGTRLTGSGPADYPSFFGNVFRNHDHLNVVDTVMRIGGGTASGEDPWMPLNVVERVTAENAPTGLNFLAGDGAVTGWLIRECDFDRGTADYSGSQAVFFEDGDMRPIMMDNSYTGFETTYAGDAPGDVLATTRRVIDLTAPDYGTAQTELIVRNAGTSSLSWSVSDDAAWLSIGPSSGNVGAEGDSSGVTMTADASSLTPGEYTGTVTLSDGTDSMKLTVNFTVEEAPLAAYLRLDEGSGSTAEDASGWDNDGALNGDPAWIASTPTGAGSALEFDGDDWVNLGDDTSQAVSDTMTLAFWVKADPQSGYPRVAAKSGGGAGWEVQSYDNNDRIGLRVDTSASANQQFFVNGPMDGLWNHMAWVIDEGAVTRYLNGQQYGGAQTVTLGNGFGSTADLVLGGGSGGGGAFEGALDEFYYSTEAVSPGAVAALYAAGVQTVTIEATDAAADERSTDTGTFAVTRTLAGSGALTVNYTTGGSATSGDDYTALTGSVEIPADTASATVTVTPVDDSDFEWTETVEATLSTSANYAIGGAGSATVELRDNENDPVAFIAMDEGAGSTAYDETPNGNDGSLTGGPAWITDTPDADAYALDFDGSDDYLDCGDDASMQEGDTATIAFWVKADSQGSFNRLMGKREGVQGWEVQAEGSSDNIALRVDTTAGTNTRVFCYDVLDGVWNHVVFTIDNGTVKSYRNGAQNYSRGYPVGDGLDNLDTLVLGANSAGSANFDGALDEFLLYDYVLDSTDIAALYAEGVQRVSVEATDTDAAEASQDTGEFTIARAIGSPDNLTVNYSTGGSAASGSDYTALAGSATIAGNATSTAVTLTPVDDSDFELPETVELTLTSGTGYTVVSPSSATVTIADDDNAPVAYIALDEGSGTTAYDSTTNGNDGALTNGPAWIADSPDADGYALDFDGDDDYLDCGNDASMQEGDTATVSFWVKAGTQPGYVRLVGKRSGVQGWEITANGTSDGILMRVDTTAQTNRLVFCNGALNNVWNHVAFAIDNGTVRAYLNGDQVSSRGYTVGNGLDNLDDLVLGASSSGTANFDGALDEFRLYDTTLSGDDIAVLYSEGVQRVTVEASDASADEQSTDTGAFTLKRAIGGGDLTVNFNVTGTATPSDDYSDIDSSVQIDAGDASADITVTPVDDDAVEGTESVVMTLAAAAGYAIDTPSSATVNIADNDAAFDGFESGAFTGGEGFVENTWTTLGVMDVVDTGTPYSGDYHLRLRDRCDMQRTVDLTGYSSATLELAWKAVSFETGDGATVEIYDNGSWSTLLTIDDDDDDGAWHTESIDLSSYTLNDEVIFRISADMGDLDDTLYIDDFAVIV